MLLFDSLKPLLNLGGLVVQIKRTLATLAELGGKETVVGCDIVRVERMGK
jgi:hypothetical protein